MNIFLDTEFTDFYEPCLISMGLASEYGEDFYAEVPYPDHACSAFVREAVLPLLRKYLIPIIRGHTCLWRSLNGLRLCAGIKKMFLFVSITKRIGTYFVMPSIIECRLGAITSW
jgi:hypothetical protein